MPYDNSVMESFFGSFKREALYRYRFKTEKDFFESVETYIRFYNSKRPHSVLMNQTPDKFEIKYFNNYNKKRILKPNINGSKKKLFERSYSNSGIFCD